MPSKQEKTKQKWANKFLGKIISSILILPIVMWLWPWAVPFRFFELWESRGTISEWLYTAWPIFVWGSGFTLFFALRTRNDRKTNRHAEDILKGGTLISIVAGVMEEMTFRWLFFLDNIVSVKLTNFFIFGFLGFGIPEWLHLRLVGPIVNEITLHGLEPYLFHPTGWAVGAAMVTTNAFFRDGHKYQGIFGWINSWFGGMFLFYIMFTYGIVAAIVVHFVLVFLIFFLRFLYVAF